MNTLKTLSLRFVRLKPYVQLAVVLCVFGLLTLITIYLAAGVTTISFILALKGLLSNSAKPEI